jgi:serine/threonine protein phosphatase 1
MVPNEDPLVLSRHAPCVPEDTVVYAVGDIHGCAHLLDKLHEQILRDAENVRCERRVVIYLGDYVDRGPDSRGVVSRLLDGPLDGFETHFLMGNHEEFLLDFLEDVEAGPGWLFNGGHATLMSYGVDLGSGLELDRTSLEKIQQEFLERLPAAHLDFYRELEFSCVEGDYFFVHAGVRPGVDLQNQSDEDMLWIRDEFLNADDDFGKIVVHGHTITWEPEFRHNRIGIDTGAFTSGVLTALALEGHEQEIVTATEY